jgi:hypothetical protein
MPIITFTYQGKNFKIVGTSRTHTRSEIVKMVTSITNGSEIVKMVNVKCLTDDIRQRNERTRLAE